MPPTTTRTPRWPQTLARYPFAAALLPGWRDHAAELPNAYVAALETLLLALDQQTALDERYQHLVASRAQLASLRAQGDEHIATQLLSIRVHSALGEQASAQPLAQRLLQTLEEGAEKPEPALDRPFLPATEAFEHCPLQEDQAGPWLTAMLLDMQLAWTRADRHQQPKSHLPRLAKRSKLPGASIETERMLALAALRAGKKVTIKEGSRLVTATENGAIWQQLGQSKTQTPATPPPHRQPAAAGSKTAAASPWSAIAAKPGQDRLLLLTTDFPPYDGGRVGHSIRMYALANFLAEKGYRVYVYLVKNSQPASRDKPPMHADVVLLNEHFTQSGGEVSFCSTCLDQLGISTVLSSSPPLVNHQIAGELKARRGDKLYWHCDIRDVSSLHPMTKRGDEQQNQQLKKLELSLMAAANTVTAVSTGMISAINRMTAEMGIPDFSDRIHLVENGYLDVVPMEPQPAVRAFVDKHRRQGRVVLVYAGTGTISGNIKMEKGYKDLTALLDVMMASKTFRTKFALIIQGAQQINKQYFSRVQKALNLLFLPPVDNDQSVANMKLADIGVAVNLDRITTPVIMGGKIYDYVASGLGLLLIYPTNAESLLTFSARHGDKAFFADIYDPNSIKSTLQKILSIKGLLEQYKFTDQEIICYHRHQQYAFFLQALGSNNYNKNPPVDHGLFQADYSKTNTSFKIEKEINDGDDGAPEQRAADKNPSAFGELGKEEKTKIISRQSQHRLLMLGTVRDRFPLPICQALAHKKTWEITTWGLQDVVRRRLKGDIQGVHHNEDVPQPDQQLFSIDASEKGQQVWLLHRPSRTKIKAYPRRKFEKEKALIRKDAKFEAWCWQVNHEIRNFSVINFHQVIGPFLRVIPKIPLNVGVVISFWGSDLYRQAGPAIYTQQFQALSRADYITCHSQEMSDLLVAKFGLEIERKIRQVLVGVDGTMFDLIDQYFSKSFLEKKPLKDVHENTKKVNVVCGNSGNEVIPHNKIVSALAGLGRELRDRICIIVPLTYGPGESIRKSKSLYASLDAEVIILTEYLSEEEIADLRFHTDLFIHIPKSDAMSAAMSESLYAGSTVITGKWLPYARLRESGLPLVEIFKLEHLEAAIAKEIEKILSDETHSNRKERTRPWAHWLRSNVTASSQVDIWDEIFKDAIEQAKSRSIEVIAG